MKPWEKRASETPKTSPPSSDGRRSNSPPSSKPASPAKSPPVMHRWTSSSPPASLQWGKQATTTTLFAKDTSRTSPPSASVSRPISSLVKVDSNKKASKSDSELESPRRSSTEKFLSGLHFLPDPQPVASTEPPKSSSPVTPKAEVDIQPTPASSETSSSATKIEQSPAKKQIPNDMPLDTIFGLCYNKLLHRDCNDPTCTADHRFRALGNWSKHLDRYCPYLHAGYAECFNHHMCAKEKRSHRGVNVLPCKVECQSGDCTDDDCPFFHCLRQWKEIVPLRQDMIPSTQTDDTKTSASNMKLQSHHLQSSVTATTTTSMFAKKPQPHHGWLPFKKFKNTTAPPPNMKPHPQDPKSFAAETQRAPIATETIITPLSNDTQLQPQHGQQPAEQPVRTPIATGITTAALSNDMQPRPQRQQLPAAEPERASIAIGITPTPLVVNTQPQPQREHLPAPEPYRPPVAPYHMQAEDKYSLRKARQESRDYSFHNSRADSRVDRAEDEHSSEKYQVGAFRRQGRANDSSDKRTRAYRPSQRYIYDGGPLVSFCRKISLMFLKLTISQYSHTNLPPSPPTLAVVPRAHLRSSLNILLGPKPKISRAG